MEKRVMHIKNWHALSHIHVPVSRRKQNLESLVSILCQNVELIEFMPNRSKFITTKISKTVF